MSTDQRRSADRLRLIPGLFFLAFTSIVHVRSAPALTPGTQLWASTYNGPGNGEDQGFFTAVSPNGKRVFMTGHSEGGGTGDDLTTIAYDASTGKQHWVSRYNGPANGDDEGWSIAVSPDGTRVFATGYSEGTTSGDDYFTIAYNASTGVRIWTARYNGPANDQDQAYYVSVSPDGSRVYVVGQSNGIPSTGYDYATVAYDATNGTQLWVARYNGPGNQFDNAYTVIPSPDGTKVFVTGLSIGVTSGVDYATVAYNAATGAQLWVARYNGPGNSHDDAHTVTPSPDGTKVYVTGRSVGATSGDDYATIAYDATSGAELWVARYNGTGNDNDQAYVVVASPDGSRVFVTGRSKGADTANDYATVAYDATSGAELWVARYNGPGNLNDATRWVGVSPDGTSVYVTGNSRGSGTLDDVATIAYDATTGAQQWVARYDGSSHLNDFTLWGRVSPDGTKVFVTGATDNPTTGNDYVTVAYSA
jgi:DNA-binding beta-propeller fold protein YncE